MRRDHVLEPWEMALDIELVARRNGPELALSLCQEECGELVQAISKLRRAELPEKEQALAHLAEEIGDVVLTAFQAAYLLHLEPSVQYVIRDKLLVQLGLKEEKTTWKEIRKTQ